MDPTLMPVTGNAKLDHYLTIIGIAVTLASGAATFINAKVRAAIDSEGEVLSPFLYLALIVNVLALNIDKATQMSKILRGKSVAVITVRNEGGGKHADEVPHA